MRTIKRTLIGLIVIGFMMVLSGAIMKSYQKSKELEALKIEMEGISRQNQLKKEFKDSLISEVNNYINKKAPKNRISGEAIIDACIKYNIDIKFVLAQAQLESGFGTKGIAAKTNSVWNVMSYDGWSANKIIKNGRGYNHPNESIEPYMKLLKNKYLVDGKTEYDMMQKFISSTGHRYASNPKYEEQLKYIYNRIDKQTNIDELLNNYLNI